MLRLSCAEQTFFFASQVYVTCMTSTFWGGDWCTLLTNLRKCLATDVNYTKPNPMFHIHPPICFSCFLGARQTKHWTGQSQATGPPSAMWSLLQVIDWQKNVGQKKKNTLRLNKCGHWYQLERIRQWTTIPPAHHGVLEQHTITLNVSPGATLVKG